MTSWIFFVGFLRARHLLSLEFDGISYNLQDYFRPDSSNAPLQDREEDLRHCWNAGRWEEPSIPSGKADESSGLRFWRCDQERSVEEGPKPKQEESGAGYASHTQDWWDGRRSPETGSSDRTICWDDFSLRGGTEHGGS